MTVNRARILKELEPGLHAIFGDTYNSYDDEHLVLFEKDKSTRAWEEDVIFSGLGAAPVKEEGASVTYDDGQEGWVARYNHETIALAFAITEEAMEDNQYASISKRLTKSLANSMAYTKQVKGADIFNNGFSGSYPIGDGKAFFATDHPLVGGGTDSNTQGTPADLSETALEDIAIAIASWVDERGLIVALQPQSLHIPPQLLFVATRLLETPGRVATADNDINALRQKGVFPDGYHVNHYFTDTDAYFVRVRCPDGARFFERIPIQKKMEGDFETGNVRFKSRERYSFGVSNWRSYYGSPGA